MIHRDAVIDPSVCIGVRMKVWERVRLREGATIGEDCVAGRGAYIDMGVPFGDRVKIQNNTLLYHGVSVVSGAAECPSCGRRYEISHELCVETAGEEQA